MGQALFLPPSVKGWDGGADWLNSSTLLFRQNAAFELTRGVGTGGRCDPARLAVDYQLDDAEQQARFFLELFHQRADTAAVDAIVQELRREEAGSRRPFSGRARQAQLARSAAHFALTMPEYQLG
jgi:uncharacterized protein (DUF1800 family)